MNAMVTSREEILKICREIVSSEGLTALNMRSVAKALGVSLGSLYNYFPSKDELVLATIESVWQDIFHMDRGCGGADQPFLEYVRWMFESVQEGALQYPNFFTSHSLSFASGAKGKARETMHRYFSHMQAGMAESIGRDPRVRGDAFTEAFPKTEFLDWILRNLLILLVQQKGDCAVLLEVIRRTIYR